MLKAPVAVYCLAVLSVWLPQTEAQACSPPPAPVPVRTADDVWVKFNVIDNTIAVLVNNVEIDRPDERPPVTTPNTPRFVRIKQKLNSGINSILLVGFNQKSISRTHADANPWKFEYTIVAGALPGTAGNLFAVVSCNGSQQSQDNDIQVLKHEITLNVQ